MSGNDVAWKNSLSLLVIYSLQTLNCLTDVKNQWLYCSLVKERNHSFNSCWREGEQWLVSCWSLIFCHWQCLSWHSVMTVGYIMNTHGSYFSNCCFKLFQQQFEKDCLSFYSFIRHACVWTCIRVLFLWECECVFMDVSINLHLGI